MADRAALALDAVLELRSQAGDVDDALLDLNPDTWEQAVLLLHHLRLARQTLAAAESKVETLAARLMAEARVFDGAEVDGIGVVQRRNGGKRKQWDHEGLAKKVMDTHLEANAGELPLPWEVRDWLLEALAPSYWRVGVLKKLGVDVDDYVTTEPGRPTVQITTNDSIQKDVPA